MTKIFPFEYDQHDLANGLRLITVPTGDPHVVSLQIVVHVGSRNEVEEGKSGFAHLFEHMMFRGTALYPPERYEAVLKQAGASQNAYTDDDLTVYHTTFVREDLGEILAMEADRFANLEYSEDVFRTEARAVLAEYNKDSAEPFTLLNEKLREACFEGHPYRHTTMGFLRDIERMPELYEFSREFHRRYYRPENTTLIVAGDVEVGEVLRLVNESWGAWARGSFVTEVPGAQVLEGPKEVVVEWPAETLPLMQVAWRMPAYSDETVETAALDLLSYLYFSQASELFEELVLVEQTCDVIQGMYADHLDPYLYVVTARVQSVELVEAVRKRVLETVERMKTEPVDAARLETVKSHLRYAFAMRMEHTEGVASLLARYVGLRRTPETIERLFDQYRKIQPEDLVRVARSYFVDANRVVAVLRRAA
jgi:zinc protease